MKFHFNFVSFEKAYEYNKYVVCSPVASITSVTPFTKSVVNLKNLKSQDYKIDGNKHPYSNEEFYSDSNFPLETITQLTLTLNADHFKISIRTKNINVFGSFECSIFLKSDYFCYFLKV